MKYNYYIQAGNNPAVNLFSAYGVEVSKTEGLNDFPDLKTPFKRDWKDEQGDDVFIPQIKYYKSKTIKVSFLIRKSDSTTVRQTISQLRSLMLTGEQILYFDSFKQNGFRGYYNKSKVGQERFRETRSFVEWTVEFSAPNGLCWGYNNEGSFSMDLIINTGSADFYFSDGTQMLEVTQDSVKNLENGFVIVCPSEFDNTIVSSRINKIFVTSLGKILSTNAGKILTT